VNAIDMAASCLARPTSRATSDSATRNCYTSWFSIERVFIETYIWLS